MRRVVGDGGLVPLVVVLALCALSVLLAPGCGASARSQRLTVLAATAGAVGVAAEVVRSTATGEAQACPDDPCLLATRERWAPADTAIDGLSLALGAWLTAESAGAGVDGPSLMLRVAALYVGLAELLGRYGVALPTIGGL